MLRKILLTVVGHVDHGKSSILDAIRGTTVAEREAGLITQAIGASIIPLETINRTCKTLLQATGKSFTVPGLLAIDTPGHAAFSNLRKRGGALADIAVVVVDINEGFRPQTEEAIEILRASKTPFIIAANKMDLIPSWQPDPNTPLLASLPKQPANTQTAFENKFYEIIGQMYEKFQMNAERFDRLEDYTKQIAVVPVSAKTGEGIPELLMVAMGLAQRFLEQNLQKDEKRPAKGTILEVKDEKGLGTTMDAIIYDGHIKVNDPLIIGGIDGPIVTKVKALFEPAPLAEMREKRSKFKSVKEVHAATGVKISAKDIQDVIGGMPFETDPDIEAAKARVQEAIEETRIDTEEEGIIIKADSIGSLEALTVLLREKEISIRKASIGNITRKDIIDAESNLEKDPLLG
ncbi:MAG: translation initiation factor IF-2, partial [Candidatus Nanoarchaeia archaeon]